MNQREKNSVDEKEILAALKNKSEFISIDFCQILYQFLLIMYDTEE